MRRGRRTDAVRTVKDREGSNARYTSSCLLPALGEGLKTYKRRRLSKGSSESACTVEESAPACAAGQSDQKATDGLGIGTDLDGNVSECERHTTTTAATNHSNFSSARNPRDAVLEQLRESLHEEKDGIVGCIQDAIKYQRDHDGTFRYKEERLSRGSENAASAGASTSGGDTISGQCQSAFFSVIVSEDFTSLCNLFVENFTGMKTDGLLNFYRIHSRMKGGVYENAPEQFAADMEQVCGKITRIGSEMVACARRLSETSKSSCRKSIKVLADIVSEERALKVGEFESSRAAVPQGMMMACYAVTCKVCGILTDGKDCLACDYCEGMYHVTCISPPVKVIPTRNWYCAACCESFRTAVLPHDGCAVCARLDGRAVDARFPRDAPSAVVTACKICGGEIDGGEPFRTCRHPFCPNKHYHVRCLTSDQLKPHHPSSSWYCPSCLCRVCRMDRDDDGIVLCDGCNDAYHTYCMTPPCDSVPEGQWFCEECRAALLRIAEVRTSYLYRTTQSKF